MKSMIRNTGRGMVLEIELDSTGGNRDALELAALCSHGLRPGQVAVEFLTPSTQENDI